MFYILRIIAEFFNYFFAMNAFTVKKKVSLAARVINLIYSFGAVFDDDCAVNLPRLSLEECFDRVKSLLANNCCSNLRIYD